MNAYVYLKGLRRVDYSVFCVADGQKSYWDNVFGRNVPFSSGQQVKRSILDMFVNEAGVKPAPITFVSKMNAKGAIEEGEVLSLCDPTYPDQLLGGWMYVPKKNGEEAKSNEKNKKRRSPLSISAMRLVHPLLGGLAKENISFDRSDRPDIHKVVVRDTKGNELTEEEIAAKLEGSGRSLRRKWIQDNTRATGLFVYDVAIDLRTLFSVQTNQTEPEIDTDMIKKLTNEGWVTSKNVFGNTLVLPKPERDKLIPFIAKSLINWRITSNQARTFSLMETLAVAISHNANDLASSIYAKLIDNDESPKALDDETPKTIDDENPKVRDDENPKARLIIDSNSPADLFIAKPSEGYAVDINATYDALQKAEEKLIEMLNDFDYENQITS